MDQSYIMPFIKSVQNVFEMMIKLPVQIGEPSLKKGGEPSYDVSGIIGMSGDVEGSVVLSFPTATAERIVALFVGEELQHTHGDFADAIGELVNMVTGGAKAQFTGKQVTISCPSVVIGSNHMIHGRKDVVCVSMPCQSDCGDFMVEIAFKQDSAAAQSTGQAAASA